MFLNNLKLTQWFSNCESHAPISCESEKNLPSEQEKELFSTVLRQPRNDVILQAKTKINELVGVVVVSAVTMEVLDENTVLFSS